MADGYGWLLNNCGDLELAAHAEHLDEDRPQVGCVYCPGYDPESHAVGANPKENER